MSNELVQSSAETEGVSLLSQARAKLEPLGLGDYLADLSDDASEEVLMARLVEVRPNMNDSWTREIMKLIVSLSEVLTSKKHTAHLLAPVERFAFDQHSPFRHDALYALSSINPAAKAILDDERKAKLAAQKNDTAAQVHECCGDH